jgi:hypothetical protein
MAEKTYMMENDTFMSAEADDSTYPPTRRFFAPDGTPLPTDYPGPIGAEWWSWHKISREEWEQLPERYRQFRISLAKRAPVSVPVDYPSEEPDGSKPG